MGGKILEYEAKTLWRKGFREGLQEALREEFPEGFQEALTRVFQSKIRSGCSAKEAMELTGITKEQADKALKELGVKNS